MYCAYILAELASLDSYRSSLGVLDLPYWAIELGKVAESITQVT